MFFLGHKLAASLLLLVFLAIMYLIPKIRKSGGKLGDGGESRSAGLPCFDYFFCPVMGRLDVFE